MSSTPICLCGRSAQAHENGLPWGCSGFVEATAAFSAVRESLVPLRDHEMREELIERDQLQERVDTLQAALWRCASAAGHPDAAQGCRNIIAIVKETTG